MGEQMTDAAYVFLDTNVLLHFQPPDKFDWPALCGAQEARLVAYPLLLTEIAKAKDRDPVKHLRARARAREAWLRERLGRIGEPVCPGVFIHPDPQLPLALLAELGLDRQFSDDLIIAHAVGYHREGKRVFVATADGGLAMRLGPEGIPVLVPDERLRLEREPDPEKQRADELDRQLKVLLNRQPELRVVSPREVIVRRQQGLGEIEAYVQGAIAAADASYRAKRTGSAFGRQPYLLDSVHSPQHQQELDQARAYLRDRHVWLERVEGAVRLHLTVRNSGRLTANDVRLRLYAPQHVILYGPGGLGPPPRRVFHSAVFAGLPVEPLEQAWDDGGGAYGVIDGRPRLDSARRMAEFTWPCVQHEAEVSSAAFWITAGREARPGRLALEVEVLCAEVGDAQKGRIDLMVLDTLAPA